MFVATKDKILPTTVIGSYPRPHWYKESLNGRSFKDALTDQLFREQYFDAVSSTISDQTRAGLDIVTDGDSRFDLDVGGRSWFFYTIERLKGIEGSVTGSTRWKDRFGIYPGHILWEVQEAYQPARVVNKIGRGSLEYTDVWKTAQKFTDKPVKFGSISAQCIPGMLENEYYESEQDLVMDLANSINQELKELDNAGCPVIQVEEPAIHMGATTQGYETLEFLVKAFNKEVSGIKTEVWAHTCWGNPNQQSMQWNRPSYKDSLEYLWQLDADVITFECASSEGAEISILSDIPKDKKLAIGVVSHTNTNVEPPEIVAEVIRKALKIVPPERLIVSSDCGFGREGLSRRIAFYKCVSIVMGTNIVRKELGLPEVDVPAANEKLYF